jgi:DNA-binding YbaB/EbfC family protein
MPGFDINQLMQQAQALQQRMQEAQERLAKKEVTGSAGGGMVVVTASGKGEILKVQIDKQAVDPRDVPMLEDLVLAAVNGALRAAQEAQAAEAPLQGMPDLSGLAGMFGGFPK